MTPMGQPEMVPVGSTAVREAILDYQPLLGLHGHIHESPRVAKLGRTTVVNPGSAHFAVVQSRGMKHFYFTLQKWATVAVLVSLAITLLVLLLTATGAIDFASHFDKLAAAGAYKKVTSDATAAGVNLHPATKLGPTLQFMIWPAFSLFFAVLSVSFSGEIKNVKRGQLIGITSAMVAPALLLAAIMLLSTHAVGSSWMLAATSPDGKFPLDTGAFVNVLAMIAGGHWWLSIVMDLWAILIIMFVAGTTLVYSSRAMLAWGLDGMAPERLAAVSDKRHTPGSVRAALCPAGTYTHARRLVRR